MTMLVEDAVPMFSAPAASIETAAAPDRPESLTVKMALAVRETEPRRHRIPRNK
jgi:hypothetical protein